MRKSNWESASEGERRGQLQKESSRAEEGGGSAAAGLGQDGSPALSVPSPSTITKTNAALIQCKNPPLKIFLIVLFEIEPAITTEQSLRANIKLTGLLSLRKQLIWGPCSSSLCYQSQICQEDTIFYQFGISCPIINRVICQPNCKKTSF